MNFQTTFNGPFPFNANGVIIGLPSVSFAEEMQTKITFQGGRISLGTLHHENMHQWWGDNVSEDKYERTFFKEGYADLSEGYNAARTAANAAGGIGTPAGDAAFDNSLSPASTRPTTAPAPTPRLERRAVEPDEREPVRQPDLHPLRPRLHRAAPDPRQGQLRQGQPKEIQTTYGGGSITQPQQIAIYQKWMPNQIGGCAVKLDEFFKQWWDTAYVGSPAAGNKPQITGPGLAGGGFYDANGGCSDYGTTRPARPGGTVPATLS